MALVSFLILGSGYTGERVAQRLLARGEKVIVTSRNPARLADLKQAGASVYALDLATPKSVADLARVLPPNLRVLYSIPPGTEGLDTATQQLLAMLQEGLAARLVYISTTGVYGDTSEIDETTPPNPRTASQQARLKIEQAIQARDWSSLVLRPAAIYGPGRGVQVSMQQSRYKLIGDGSNYLSRIQVDDLAAHCEAGLLSDSVNGAYPVADENPARAREVAAFCAELLGLPMPPSVPSEAAHETLRANHKVNGRAIRTALALSLLYPSYREGIPAALQL